MRADSGIFRELEHELMTNDQPSDYLETLLDKDWFREEPFKELYLLSKTQQSPIHHPEGSAWKHTMLVVDEAAKVKDQSTNPRAFMWAAFLHDIGKPKTTRNRKGKITAYDHDRIGARLAHEFLTTFIEEDEFVKYTCSLVRWHMMILYVTKELPFGDKVQMAKEVKIKDIGLLGMCDRMGRHGANEEDEKQAIKLFYDKVEI